jgi:lipoprotein-anchoring transpeptidase ErfK/SrfK
LTSRRGPCKSIPWTPAARDAALDYSSGRIEIVEEQDGRAVERSLAVAALQDAVADSADAVELPVAAVAPEVTTDAYHKVLLVRQDERRLYLYLDGEVQREWPVAIGMGGSPTPTGEFTVGAKRNGPTWYNPAPNGWGANMPRVIGPGPNNPLGLRALNWDRDGYDTLIRFHGTSNVGSIGRAASRGCVRLTNPDVIELFDAVPSGTPIVSIWG